MVLETYFPEKEWTFEEIDHLIRKEKNKYTWAVTFWPIFLKVKCRLHNISTWSDQAFIERRWDYMRERSGEEYTKIQIENCPDLNFILACMKKTQNDPRITKEARAATLSDIGAHLNLGAYVGVIVNGKALKGDDGASAHYVLIYGVDETKVYLHNPGNPPMPEQAVSVEKFLKCWAFGVPENYGLTAYYNAASTK